MIMGIMRIVGIEVRNKNTHTRSKLAVAHPQPHILGMFCGADSIHRSAAGLIKGPGHGSLHGLLHVFRVLPMGP